MEAGFLKTRHIFECVHDSKKIACKVKEGLHLL